MHFFDKSVWLGNPALAILHQSTSPIPKKTIARGKTRNTLVSMWTVAFFTFFAFFNGSSYHHPESYQNPNYCMPIYVYIRTYNGGEGGRGRAGRGGEIWPKPKIQKKTIISPLKEPSSLAGDQRSPARPTSRGQWVPAPRTHAAVRHALKVVNFPSAPATAAYLLLICAARSGLRPNANGSTPNPTIHCPGEQ